MDSDPADLSVAALRRLYASRALSPLECWEAVERRIAAWEPRIAALYAYDPEGARRAAVAATGRWARGEPAGPLDGIPVTVKEFVATRGVPVPMGTAAVELVPAVADAPPAARLREAGAILFAKTTAPDFGMLSSSLSTFHPLSRNPWDTALSPGGSSAGAGAAAAAGYGPLHLGTDIGGSIRLPAGWTGTVGFKPSHGRVPIDPFYLGRVAGPMTRRVADAAAMMAVLSLPDWRDPTSLPPTSIDWTALDGPALAGRRVGLMMEAGCGLPVHPEIAAAVLEAADVFTEMGAIVEPVRPILTREMLDGLDTFWRARSWADILALPPERQARILPYIRNWASAAERASAVEVVRGFNQTFAMRRAAATLFRSVDLVLSPTAPVPAFPADKASPVDDPGRPFEHIGFTVPWNMSEHPAISLNCGFTAAGLPIGLQIVGPRFDDMATLRAAVAYEARRGPLAWPRPG